MSTPTLHMNTSLHSNMGAAFSILANYDEDNENKEDCIYPEASPEIRILIIYEQPQGTGLHMTLTLNPTITAEGLKTDLANLINVPMEFIKLIHQAIALEDEKSLQSQKILPNDTIVLRDSRLTYNFP
uniref:Ubiquitin-like domain-containing protein n=1 Tax=Arion vulgaris TaxID=1028688 RepID=A0A0B7B1T0_9EUPU